MHEFARWYVGSFLVAFGALMMWRGRTLSGCRQFFFFELRDPLLRERFSRVIERRNAIEGENATGWRIAGVASVVFGGLVLAGAMAADVGYALLCADMALIMSQIYLRMRNRSPRRAASLQPRSLTSSVPAVCFAGGIVSALLPLSLWSEPSARVSSLIVSAACLIIVYVAVRTSEMAALLDGDDPDVELYVDNRLRWSRVAGMLALGYAASCSFVGMNTPALRSSTLMLALVQIVSLGLFFGFGIWALYVYFHGRMRAPTSA